MVGRLTPADVQSMVTWEEVMEGEGFSLYQLSQARLGVNRSEWSPDGRHLMLQVNTGSFELGPRSQSLPIIVDINSQAAWSTYVKEADHCLDSYAWSPDGSHLVYLQDHRLWITNADGLNPQEYPFPEESEVVYSPSYSPDGDQIALLASRAEPESVYYDLWVRPADDATYRNLVQDAGYGPFIWSPEGDEIALLNESGLLWITDVWRDISTQVDLGPRSGSEVCVSPPEWVADGQKILVAIDYPPKVWLVDLGGDTELLLGNTHHSSQRSPGVAKPLYGGLQAWASASPDGRYAIYGSTEMGDRIINFSNNRIIPIQSDSRIGTTVWSPTDPQFVSSGINQPLLLVSAEDGTVRQLDPMGMFPAWSPNGQWLVYWKIERFSEVVSYSLWLIDVVSLQRTQLLEPEEENPSGSRYQWVYDITPHWSPDGRSVALVSNRMGDPQTFVIQFEVKYPAP